MQLRIRPTSSFNCVHKQRQANKRDLLHDYNDSIDATKSTLIFLWNNKHLKKSLLCTRHGASHHQRSHKSRNGTQGLLSPSSTWWSHLSPMCSFLYWLYFIAFFCIFTQVLIWGINRLRIAMYLFGRGKYRRKTQRQGPRQMCSNLN